MGYRVLGKTEDLFQGYTQRRGLEGPFLMGRNYVVYYDPKEGQYWDPRTDFYLTNEEVAYYQNQLLEMLAK